MTQLHGRVCDALNLPQKAATWNQRKAEWLASVSSYASQLQEPFVVDEAQHMKVMADLEGAQAALTSALGEQRRLLDVVERLKEAKDAEEVAEVLAPASDIDAFEVLRSAALDSFDPLPAIAVEAIRYKVAQGYLPRARPFDDQRRDEIDDAETAGWLVVRGDDELSPNEDVVLVETAIARVTALDEFMSFAGDEFRAWFRKSYGMSPNLEKELVWDKIFC